MHLLLGGRTLAAALLDRCQLARKAGADLSDAYFVMIGAGSAMGPFPKLLELGANVVAIDIPGAWGKGTKRPVSGLSERLIATAKKSPGGSITFPLAKKQADCKTDLELYEAAGCNLMEQPASISEGDTAGSSAAAASLINSGQVSPRDRAQNEWMMQPIARP